MLPFPHASFARSDIGLAVPIGAGDRTPYNPVPAVVFPPTAQAGDFFVFHGAHGSVGGGGYTVAGLLRYRHLTAADLIPGARSMSGVVAWALYRGVYAAALKSSGSSLGTVPLTGFTKSTKCAGLLAIGSTPSPIGSAPGASLPLIDRWSAHDNDSAAASIHDLLDHRSYVNGTTLYVNGSTGFEQTTTAQLFELLF